MIEYDKAALGHMVCWLRIRRGANERDDKEAAKTAEDSIFAILGMIADAWSPVSEPLELSDEERGIIMAIPNFDAEKWKSITGIEVGE